VAGLGDPGIDLLARQLTALARLRPLGHLDLDFRGVGQVVAGDAEAARGHLLDGAALGIAVGHGLEALGILAALAGVAATAEAVHGDGQRLVRLFADRTVGHGAGLEALDDVLDGLDLVDGDRLARRLESHEAAQGVQVLRLVVDEQGVLLEDA
jgi:hypothetical protein